jgi:hypothetical protein
MIENLVLAKPTAYPGSFQLNETTCLSESADVGVIVLVEADAVNVEVLASKFGVGSNVSEQELEASAAMTITPSK